MSHPCIHHGNELAVSSPQEQERNSKLFFYKVVVSHVLYSSWKRSRLLQAFGTRKKFETTFLQSCSVINSVFTVKTNLPSLILDNRKQLELCQFYFSSWQELPALSKIPKILMCHHYSHSLSVNATRMVSRNCQIIGELAVIILVTQQINIATE